MSAPAKLSGVAPREGMDSFRARHTEFSKKIGKRSGHLCYIVFMADTVAISVRIPKVLLGKLDQSAAEADRSRNWMIVDALETAYAEMGGGSSDGRAQGNARDSSQSPSSEVAG